MALEQERNNVNDPDEPPSTSLTTDQQDRVFLDIVHETLPDADEEIREWLEGSETEGQGE